MLFTIRRRNQMRVPIPRPLAFIRVVVTLLTLTPLAFGFLVLAARLPGGHPAVLYMALLLAVGVVFGVAALASAVARPRWHHGIGLVYFAGLACTSLLLLASDARSALVWTQLVLSIFGMLLALIPERAVVSA
jgi:hypothetical protein